MADSQTIKVRLASGAPKIRWLRQFPDHRPVWGNCTFILKPDNTDFDWIFVYDEVKYRDADNRIRTSLIHHCNPKNSILLTVEPPNIKSYGRAYTKQFGWVLTSQPPWALPHNGRIYSQPALLWFYGAHNGITLNTMKSSYPDHKTGLISTVCSYKKQWHTLHRKRFHFIRKVKEELPELDVFGRGIRPIHDKSEALDEYRYHIAIENYFGPHHWTEKLADAFLGACLPFYAGCPNAADYFPADSFIPIDIRDPAGAVNIISNAIRENAYEKRLPSILEARRRVLEQYNLFAVLSREIEARHSNEPRPTTPQVLLSRVQLRKRLDIAIMDLYDKTRLRLRYSFQR